MKQLAACGALVAVLMVSGCVVVPTPEHGLIEGRGLIDRAAQETVQPGVTTREEVLLRFGEPDATLRQQEVFVYYWSRVQGYFAYAVAAGYTGAAGGGPIGRVHLFLIEFDKAGRVRRCEETGPHLMQLPPDRADEWAGITKPARVP
jgi:outer membrane protein assembly factor BamE (lipoprotein component of BamABCDE complex)